MANIKKTMEAPLAYLVALNVMSEAQLNEFQTKFCYAAAGSVSNGPREITILKDADGEMLGRKCMVTNLFYVADRFAKGTTCIKEADGAKGKLYTESKKMEKEAMSLLDEAREIEDIEERVAKFEAYDQALQDAKVVRTQPVVIQDEWLEGGFATIEDLALDLGVEVQPEEK